MTERHYCDEALADAGIANAEAEYGGGAQDKADLAQLNSNYAVVQIGGMTRVMSFEDDPTYRGCTVPVFQTIADFTAFHHKRTKKNEKDKPISVGKWWIAHPERRQYSAVVYAPNASQETMVGKFNLWRGFACEPKVGCCTLYLEHLFEVICCGNKEHYVYLLNWMAYAVQRPDRQGEVAIVMRGREGTGKGVCAKYFGSLFGPHYRHIAHAHHLVGHFNAHQQQCSVLFADEALFAGDRSHEGILKYLITEESLQIEMKGVDSFTVPNRMHIMMASNSAWVVPAGADARRYFVLDVADTHIRDFEYFGGIASEMDNGGRGALLRLLQLRDLAGFNVRDVPQTQALADQKRHSRRGVDAVVEHLAGEGELWEARPGYPDMAITTERDGKASFFKRAQSIAPDLKHMSWTVVQKELKDQWGCEHWRANSLNGLKFLPLRELRKRFDFRYGAQEWDRPNDNWGDPGAEIDENS